MNNVTEEVSSSIAAERVFSISGMTCAACAARIEKKLNKVPGVHATVNLATEQAHIQISQEAEQIADSELIDIVEKAGYGAVPVQSIGQLEALSYTADDIPDTDEAAIRMSDLLRRFKISFALSVPIVLISMIPSWQFLGWQWVAALLASVVAFYCAWPFHRAAFRATRHASSTMDTLVSLGIIASILWSFWALFFGGAGTIGYTMYMSGVHLIAEHGVNPHVYFESVAMIVTFLLLGRWLEARSRRSAGNELRALLNLGAATARVVRRSSEGESLVEIAGHDLRVGDVFLVRPGEKIATDGVVLSGASAVDVSFVTGESIPVEVQQGSEVIGATINTYGVLEVRATRVGAQTTLFRMGRLLAEAQAGKAHMQRLADKVSSVFVPVVLLLAMGDLLCRLAVGNSYENALTSAITVLVVACPCALGLATPTALLVGSSAASRQGILIRSAEVLECAHRVSVALLDKTGTLTRGEMSVACVKPSGTIPEDQILELAGALESRSEHPIAQAIAREPRTRNLRSPESFVVTDFYSKPGAGVRGVIELSSQCSVPLFVGSLAWVRENGITLSAVTSEAVRAIQAEGKTAIVVANEKEDIGVIVVADSMRPESIEAIEQLKQCRVTPLMLSGDSQAAADNMASRLGISALGGVLPEGKMKVVRDFQARGETVVMVGDGVNDAAALAAADLSVAMGAGTDVAKAAADITIITSDPRLVARAIYISRRTLRIIKENLVWAFAYNLIAIPLALGGVIVPGLAAAAMASSSVIVVVNSLRLRRI